MNIERLRAGLDVGAVRDNRPTAGDRILKVNHAGECGAAQIYRGQWLACRWRDPRLRAQLATFQRHEERHRAVFLEALEARGVRPCRSALLCGGGGWVLGVLTGLCGSHAIAATTVAVERVVLRHLRQQLQTLRLSDPEACRVIGAILEDEQSHHDHGLRQTSPRSWWAAMVRGVVGPLTETVIWLGMRV